MNSEQHFFVTGTDTDVGKTWVSVALMQYFKQQGYSVVGMKPVSAGCHWDKQQLKNEDALLLQEHASLLLEYKEVNPYAFEKPVSPHLAANGQVIELGVIVDAFKKLKKKAEIVIVEGAGGWLVPLNKKQDISDLVKALNIPVILVVAIRLGCINHARLSFQQIVSDGVECVGWIAVCLDADMLQINENIKTIEDKIAAPLLAVFPYTEKLEIDALTANINL